MENLLEYELTDKDFFPERDAKAIRHAVFLGRTLKAPPDKEDNRKNPSENLSIF